MNDLEKTVFSILFREAYLKCFGIPLGSPLNETDSRHFADEIFRSTGLVIGFRSLKNYSSFLLTPGAAGTREENPSAATLDTLARYVMGAPYTDEIRRKDQEGGFPYWFQYRNRNVSGRASVNIAPVKKKKWIMAAVPVLLVIIFLITVLEIRTKETRSLFRDDFGDTSMDSLSARGWIIKAPDSIYWPRRGEKTGHLTLYTLKGDNWPQENNAAVISNLLIRKLGTGSFTAEAGLSGFVPYQNWQQAGLLLAEDSTFRGKMVRLSISYNDFFGGYEKDPEILIQLLGNTEGGYPGKPEEIGHVPIFTIENGKSDLVRSNLAKSSLRIERKGDQFRFLYTSSPGETFAFKELCAVNLSIKPAFIAIFAIRGWADNDPVPVYFDAFTLQEGK